MNPSEVEQARQILKLVHKKTIERLVSFVLVNEQPLVERDEFDMSGAGDRLVALQQEIFVVSYLLSSLPAPPQPAPTVSSAPVEK
jgi:hypothetical protein